MYCIYNLSPVTGAGGERRLGFQEANKGVLYVHKYGFTFITYKKRTKTVTVGKVPVLELELRLFRLPRKTGLHYTTSDH
jgi:hypothetical protein